MIQQSSLVSEGVIKTRLFIITGVIVERTDSASLHDHGEHLNLTELWIFGSPGSEAKSCALTRATTSRWEIKTPIELATEVQGIDCIVKCDDGDDFGFLHLDIGKMQKTNMCPNYGHGQKITTNDAQIHMNMSWKVVKIPWEYTQLDLYGEYLREAKKNWTHLCFHPDVAFQLQKHGIQLFERPSDLTDLNNAILLLQQAVDLISGRDGALPSQLCNLGAALAHRFEWRGDLADIDYAIALLQQAVELTPRGHATLPTRLTATDLTPRGSADLPGYLSSLGTSVARRYERTNELSDITEAISMQQKAVEITLPGHPSLAGSLNNLGSSLMWRFERTRDIADIDGAISVTQKAVQLTSEGSYHLPTFLNNLGSAFSRRFGQTGNLPDLVDAISVQLRVAELLPQGHVNLPACLSNLGGSFTRSFERTGDFTDIDDAISVRQRAVGLTPQGHSSLPLYLTSLAHSFYSRFNAGGNSRDLEGAIFNYKEAAMSPSGRRLIKLQAAEFWVNTTLARHRPQSLEILLAFDTVLGLIASIAGLDQTVKGRYTQLESISGLARKAATAACAFGRVDKALEWLEQGRCLVWNQLNSLRTPLDELRRHDEELAGRIADVAKRLENAGSSRAEPHPNMSFSEKISIEDESRAHLDLSKRWNDLLGAARAIPGFESFLRPPPCSILMEDLPESGPIVLINVDEHRCDALALLAGLNKPLHIPLPSFSIEKARKFRTMLDSELRTRNLRVRNIDVVTSGNGERGVRRLPVVKGSGDHPVSKVLRGMWEEIVKPVLDALEFSRVDQASGEVPPRLWWCPTGPLSLLPLHAAGIYHGSETESVVDYVVSAYTPTATAIIDRVKNHRSVDAKTSGLFLTSQPSVFGASAIPGTTSEVLSILKRAEENGVRALNLEGDELTVDACLERMQEFSSIHLACHGSQNASDPLKSRFLFHRGSLGLGRIVQSNLKNADLAFLSACETSTGQDKLSDEAVHLAAGMLAAGYRRVVGTMWSIGDLAAHNVAITF
ncbi:CHAT domain-containing protein [Ephemerocybe angulata]|uniref:CHAT domain-containing protein n=1 Tax=Ephemerocybe angulata TaxID=980116 RepID=A0A8H6HFI9_9AGAR|nr:CHAT domain-containing protein [Tulosesus angulatus]